MAGRIMAGLASNALPAKKNGTAADFHGMKFLRMEGFFPDCINIIIW